MRRWIIAAAVWLGAVSAFAQVGQIPNWPSKTFVSGGGSPITLVAHTIVNGAGATITTSAIDTTGANLIVLYYSAALGGPFTASDSKSNSYTATATNSDASCFGGMYFIYGPTVGSGHTFSIGNGTAIVGTLGVQAYNNTVGSTVDQNNVGDNGAGATTVQPGSVTPSSNNEVLITGLCNAQAGGTPYTIDSGFTIIDQIGFVGGTSFGGGMANLIQTTAAVKNPTWTSGVPAVMSSSIATFK